MREPGEECVREGALRGDHRLQARPRRRKGPCDAEASVRSDESVEYVRVHIARKRIVLSDTIARLRTTSDQSCVILIVDRTDIVGADPFGTGSA